MAFHGRQARNAGKDLRITKRQEAEERNARTPEINTAAFRRSLLKKDDEK
jgi:hypothetical protein